jgi:hypothetical protein
MDTTLFLAGVWGPILFAIALGVFISPHHYKRVYRELEKDSLSALTFGIFAMSVGLAQICVHNVWDTTHQAIISFLGWGALVKGATFVIIPKFADKGGDWAADSKLLPSIGGLLLILGAYLSWIAYFS